MVHAILFSIVILALIGSIYKPFNWFAFFGLFCFAALRYNFGNDYSSYYEHFETIKATGKSPFGTEILFTALNQISPNFYFMIALMSFFLVVVLWKLVKNHVPAELIWISVFVLLINPYLFLMNLSSMRQAMALALFIIAIKYARERKIIAYSIIVFLAMMFHKTAVILFPIYFWANEKNVSKRGVLIILTGIFFFLFSPSAIMDLIERMLGLFESSNYQHYFTQDLRNTLRATLLTSISFAYVLLNLPHLKDSALLYSKLWLLGLALNVLAYRIAMLTRIEMYFSMFSIVAFPLILKNSWETTDEHGKLYNLLNQWVFPALIVLVYGLRYYSFFNNAMWRSFTSYQTILTAFFQ